MWDLLGDLTGGKTDPAWEELSVLGETGEISPPSHMHAHVYTHTLIQVLMTHKDNCFFFFNCFFFLLESKGKEIRPVHSERDQPWDFFGRNDAKAEAPVLWPPHAKS